MREKRASYCVYIFERKLMRKELIVSSIPGKIGLCYKILILGNNILTCWNFRKTHKSFGEPKNLFKYDWLFSLRATVLLGPTGI